MSRARAWLALAALLAGAAVLAWLLPLRPQDLDWQPALAAHQPWRWFTAAFVHLSALHLGANLLGTLLVAAFGREAGCNAQDALAWALAWPFTHLGLLLQPQLQHYGGLSGVLHAGVAVAALRLVLQARRGPRAVGGAVLAGLALKIVWEAPWQQAVRVVPGWDIPLAPLAHATGTVSGAVLALLLAWRRGVPAR